MLTSDELKAQQVIAQLGGADLRVYCEVDHLFTVRIDYSNIAYISSDCCICKNCQHHKFFFSKEEAQQFVKEHNSRETH